MCSVLCFDKNEHSILPLNVIASLTRWREIKSDDIILNRLYISDIAIVPEDSVEQILSTAGVYGLVAVLSQYNIPCFCCVLTPVKNSSAVVHCIQIYNTSSD